MEVRGGYREPEGPHKTELQGGGLGGGSSPSPGRCPGGRDASSCRSNPARPVGFHSSVPASGTGSALRTGSVRSVRACCACRMCRVACYFQSSTSANRTRTREARTRCVCAEGAFGVVTVSLEDFQVIGSLVCSRVVSCRGPGREQEHELGDTRLNPIKGRRTTSSAPTFVSSTSGLIRRCLRSSQIAFNDTHG